MVHIRAAMSMRSKRAFTVVELLVLIVLITTLAILGYRQFTLVKARAETAACTHNMRQLGYYIFQYGTERNGDLLPTLQITNSVSGSGLPWHTILDRTTVLPFSEWHQLEKSIMRCPSRRKPNHRRSTYGNALPSREFDSVHYGMNNFPGVSNFIPVGGRPHKLWALPHPSKTLLLAETNWYYFLSPYLSSWRIHPHQGGCNLLYADGHVAFYSKSLPVYQWNRGDIPQPPFHGGP